MRTLVTVLSIACIALAVASGYLYRELRIARDDIAAQATVSRDAQPARATLALESEQPPITDDDVRREAVVEMPAAKESDNPSDRGERRAEMRTQFQQRRSDPAFRSAALARARKQARDETPDVASVLRLSAAQEQALIELLARQSLQIDEANGSRRFGATDTDRAAAQRQILELQQRHEQERAELLGQGRYEQFQQYAQQVPERQQLRELRGRLDEANTLTTDQTNRLVEAMYQERDSYLQQLKSVEGVGGYSASYPFEAFTRDRDAAARARFAEGQLQRTEEFQSRLRLRASNILSGEQLRRFDEIQSEQLEWAKARADRQRNRANRPPPPRPSRE